MKRKKESENDFDRLLRENLNTNKLPSHRFTSEELELREARDKEPVSRPNRKVRT